MVTRKSWIERTYCDYCGSEMINNVAALKSEGAKHDFCTEECANMFVDEKEEKITAKTTSEIIPCLISNDSLLATDISQICDNHSCSDCPLNKSKKYPGLLSNE